MNTEVQPRSLTIKRTGGVISLLDFFHAFGYEDKDTVFFRLFEDAEKKKNTPEGLWWNEHNKRTCGHNISCLLQQLPEICPTVDKYNKDNTAGVFFVVNGGGTKDVDVLNRGIARAQFFEIDDLSLSDQEEAIRKAPLRPSIIVKTAKSYHTYYLLKDGDAVRFRAIQSLLAEYFGGDKSVQNESRVMRVPSFYHNKNGKVMVEVQWFAPDLKYTQDEIIEAFGGLDQNREPERKAADPEAKKETIREPNRHKTFYALACRCIEADLTREAVILALQHDNKARCEPPLPETEITNIVDCAIKYRKGEAGKVAYRKRMRAEVLASYD